MVGVNTILDNDTLQTIYTTAKINADRYNYTLLTRAILLNETDIHQCNIFKYSNSTELLFCKLLKGKMQNVRMNNMLPFKSDPDELLISKDINNLSGYLYFFNNLNINISTLISDIAYIDSKNTEFLFEPAQVNLAKYLLDHKILESLMYFYTKCTSSMSIMPYMLYLLTEFHCYGLNDLINNVPFISGLEHSKYYDFTRPKILSTALPLSDHVLINREVSGGPLLSKYVGTDFECYRMGFYETLVYGLEMMYQFSTIDNFEYKNTLINLFIQNTSKDSLFEKYLYTVEGVNIKINDKVTDCFVSNPIQRFDLFKKYFYEICKDLETVDADLLYTSTDRYKVPLVFAKFVNQMHHYAFQKCRINYVSLLYLLAKERKVLDSISSYVSAFDKDLGIPYMTPDSEEETESDAFNLLPTVKATTLEMESETLEHFKEKASTLKLDDIEKLKDSEKVYAYDINHIQSTKESATEDKELYYKVANNFKLLTHNLSKQIKEIKVYNTGGKNPGLSTGRLDKKNLYKYKTDPRIFYNNTYKIKEMDLAFGCILDESGSMRGKKVENGKIVMILLHEVLTSLNINHSIIGHTSDRYHHCEINKYYQFQEEHNFKVSKPYALSSIKAKRGNCDSGALAYMEKSLAKVKNKDKIVLIFSDGEPTECSDVELKEQVLAMQKKGIRVIGIGINFSKISQYYPDNANGKNLTEMLDIIVKILKRYVLEKED